MTGVAEGANRVTCGLDNSDEASGQGGVDNYPAVWMLQSG